jgi:hypothetical protein
MKVRIINIAAFAGLVCLIFAVGKLNYKYFDQLALACVLLVIFTSGTIIDFLLIKKWNETKITPLTIIVAMGLAMGCLSSLIIGVQRHDEYDGGPSFGMMTWPLTLGIIYPLSFSVFVFCISFLKSRTMQLCILFTWAFATIIYGYYFGDYYTSLKEDVRNAEEYYDSNYFPSETKGVTLLLAGTVLFWVSWIFIKIRSVKKTSTQLGN